MQCSLMSARRPLGLLVALTLIGGWLASASLYGAEADVTERTESGRPASGIVLTPEERAWLDAHPDIVLGMSDRFQPALIRADDGRLSGIVPDYLELINRRLGTNIRLAVSSSWEDLGQQAERREIDGLAAGGRKTARDRFVNHTLPYLVTYYYLYIRADETLATTRLDELTGKRIGYLKGALHPRSILDRYPGVIPVPLANQEEMAAALTNRRVDLIFDILFLEWWRKQHAQVSFKIGGLVEGHSNPLTFAIRNDWPLLPGILNQALRDIPESEHARIKNRWLDEVVQEPGSRLTLTPVERDWLAEHPVIRYAVDPDWAPVEFLDPEGRASGIGPEYLARIEPLLGVRFVSVPTVNWAEALRLLDQGEVDLLPSTSPTPERRKRFHFSTPHLAFPVAIFAPVEAPFLGNLEALAGKRVGVVDQYAVQEWLRQDYPEIRLVPFANTEAALREVAERRVDAFVDNLVTTSQAIGRTGLVQVRVAGMTSYEFALSMAVRQDWPILAGILEKAIAAIPERDRKSIYSRWVQVQPPATVDYRLLWNVLAGFALVLLVILLWNWSLRREMAKRQRAERVLAESERRYREMVESASANFNFYSLTPEGAFLYLSPSSRDWFGIDSARILGMPWDAIAHWSADTRRRGLSALRQCQAGEIPAPVTLELTVRGARLQLISHARPVRDDQGHVVRIEGITINMTERLKLEEDLRRAIATAEQANRTKSEFLANMSHEIRTPMNGIMGMLQLCLDTVLSEQQRTFLEKAQGASRSLLDLLNDILDLSKVEAGQLTLESTGFVLEEVIAHLDTVVGHAARDKGLAFRVEIAPEVPAWLVGDPLRLGQVLINLSGNAVKFTPRGEVRISIRVLDGRRDRIHLAFEVRDTGIGIAEARIGELFQPFQQADSSITRRYGGTGLGLSISRQLVERMEGRIRVESLPGEGSNFRFDAWFGTEPMAAAALAKGHGLAQAERPRQPILDLTGKRLLVVEDNLLNQEVVKTFLEQAGAGVEVANHGAAAVDLIERRGAGAFDAVLMDIQMPEMDGYTATRRLRELPGGASVPIIGLTAHVRREEIALIHAAGMNDHVGKPFDPAMLLSVIARHLHLPLNQTEAETSAKRDTESDATLPAMPGIDVAGALTRVGDQVSILRE